MHRTPRSAWSRWWPWLVALVVFPALAYLAVTLLSSSSGSSATSTTSSSTAVTSESPSESATDSATETAEPTETETETEAPLPDPDLARTVRVDNATTTSGLAGGARDELEAAGFTDVSTGNWDGADVGDTVVLYPAAEDLGTATQIAEVLGITRIEEDADLAGDVVLVVLEADYTP